MRWLTPQERDFAPGQRGSIVVLADHSDSISNHARMAVSQALKDLRRRILSARLFAFHADIEEVPADGDFFGTFPPNGASRWARRWANTTDIGYCLGRIAPLTPSKTILFSDGACRDKRNTLRVVERLTGSVDAFFCEPDPTHYEENCVSGHTAEQMFQILTCDADEGLMQQIARCGRGRFVRFHPDRTNLPAELTFSTADAHQEAQMARPPRQPVVNIIAPGPQYHEVVQDIYLHHRRRIHHVYEADEHIEHGKPDDSAIEIADASVQIMRRPGIAGFLLDIAIGQRTVERGKLQEAPRQAALPRSAPSVAGVPAHLISKRGQ